MAPFHRVSVGAVKATMTCQIINGATAPTAFETVWLAWGLFIANAADVAGAPGSWVNTFNPFLSETQPQGLESSKDPYGNSEEPRLLNIKFHSLHANKALTAYTATADWRFRTRGFQLKEAQMLYAFNCFYHSMAAGTHANIWMTHFGIPMKFRL